MQERYVYDPYGTVTVYSPTWTTVVGTSLAASTVGNTIGFASMVFDPVTGLYYDEARWYSTAVSTFISRDPAQADPNTYRYCGNNPVIHVDPSGLAPLPAFPEQTYENGNGITAAIQAGDMSPIKAYNGKSFPVKGKLGNKDVTVTFKFDKAYGGKRLIPQFNSFGLGMYVKLSIDVGYRASGVNVAEVNVIQIRKGYRKDNKGEPTTVDNWQVDSDNNSPYYIDQNSGVVGTGGQLAVMYDAPVTEITANGAYKNWGKVFWSVVVCKSPGKKDRAIASLGWGYYIDPNGQLQYSAPFAAAGKPPTAPGNPNPLATAIAGWNATPGVTSIDLE